MKDIKDITLGKKIRQLRIERRVTQQELVGDFITRNMLSQIENDVAMPSMKTLQYIADALEIPLSFLVDTEHDYDFEHFDKDNGGNFLADAKAVYADGDYKKCIAIIEENIINNSTFKVSHSEAYIFLSLSYLEAMNKSFADNQINVCTAYCEKLEKYTNNPHISKNKFFGEYIQYQIELYKLRCLSVQDINMNSDDFLNKIVDTSDLCRYNIILAERCIKSGDTDKVIDYLKKAEILIEEFDKHPYKREIYKTLESCYIKLDDYKNAYLYSSKLVELYSGTH